MAKIIQNNRQARLPQGAQDLMRGGVNASFLLQFGFGRGIEMLEELAESNDMDQLMGDDVQPETQ